MYTFGYGVETPAPFSQRLERLDKNKDGKLSPDEYGDDPILNSVGKNAGNRDGIVTEEEWNVFANRVLGPNCLTAVRIEKGVHVLLQAFGTVFAHYPNARLTIAGPQIAGSREFIDPTHSEPLLDHLNGFFRNRQSYLPYLKSMLSPT